MYLKNTSTTEFICFVTASTVSKAGHRTIPERGRKKLSHVQRVSGRDLEHGERTGVHNCLAPQRL